MIEPPAEMVKELERWERVVEERKIVADQTLRVVQTARTRLDAAETRVKNLIDAIDIYTGAMRITAGGYRDYQLGTKRIRP